MKERRKYSWLHHICTAGALYHGILDFLWKQRPVGLGVIAQRKIAAMVLGFETKKKDTKVSSSVISEILLFDKYNTSHIISVIATIEKRNHTISTNTISLSNFKNLHCAGAQNICPSEIKEFFKRSSRFTGYVSG